ncbi:hypothetical protein EDC01DRAFT_635269 [Geopyxis carbonaria]|nr:hypothetical protein EDC01DRAFT_635269 [Geopyxis carbonaria]
MTLNAMNTEMFLGRCRAIHRARNTAAISAAVTHRPYQRKKPESRCHGLSAKQRSEFTANQARACAERLIASRTCSWVTAHPNCACILGAPPSDRVAQQPIWPVPDTELRNRHKIVYTELNVYTCDHMRNGNNKVRRLVSNLEVWPRLPDERETFELRAADMGVYLEDAPPASTVGRAIHVPIRPFYHFVELGIRPAKQLVVGVPCPERVFMLSLDMKRPVLRDTKTVPEQADGSVEWEEQH